MFGWIEEQTLCAWSVMGLNTETVGWMVGELFIILYIYL